MNGVEGWPEIDDIVRLQAGRHTPYARDEIVVDYINLGVYGSNYTKILLVIVKREVVKRQYTLLEMAGARLDRIALIPEAIGAVALPVLKVDSMDAPVAILHVDTEITDFTAIRSEKTIFLRCIRVGSMHLALEREKYQIMFIEEVKKSLEAYQGEDVGQPPHKFIVTGVLSDAVKDLCPILGDALHIPTRAQPFVEQVPFSKQAARIASTVKDLSFLTCIAPLLVWDRLKINLLPEEVKVRRAFEKRSKALIQMGVLAMTLFILLFSVFFSRVVFKRLYLERLTAMYLPLNEEATLLEKEYANVRTVHAFLIERHLPLEALTRLHELIPDGVYLTQIKYDETTGLSIKGSAMTMTEVFVSVDGMEKSEWFSNVQTRYTTKRKEGDFDVTDFEITCVTETSG